MLEPAPEMFQCAGCGNGSTGRGFHFAWSLSSVDTVENIFSGVTCTYNPIRDSYELGTICWELDNEGNPLPTTVVSDPIETLSEDEYGDYPLPVVWLGKPGKLKSKMYKTSLGRKEKS